MFYLIIIFLNNVFIKEVINKVIMEFLIIRHFLNTYLNVLISFILMLKYVYSLNLIPYFLIKN